MAGHELYDGQALAGDVIVTLHETGFRLTGVFNQAPDDSGVPVQANILFARALSA